MASGTPAGTGAGNGRRQVEARRALVEEHEGGVGRGGGVDGALEQRVVDDQAGVPVEIGVVDQLLHALEQLLALEQLMIGSDDDGGHDAAVGCGDAARHGERQRCRLEVADGDEDALAELALWPRGASTRVTSREPTSVATMTLTRISTSTALTTDVLNRPIWKPTVVAASVAAACGVVRANTTPDCGRRTPSSGRVSSAAIALPPMHATMNSAASPSVSAREHHGRVEQQADRHEEHRDEQRRAEEVDPVHERALVRHEAVHREPGEERADDALDAERLGHVRPPGTTRPRSRSAPCARRRAG